MAELSETLEVDLTEIARLALSAKQLCGDLMEVAPAAGALIMALELFVEKIGFLADKEIKATGGRALMVGDYRDWINVGRTNGNMH